MSANPYSPPMGGMAGYPPMGAPQAPMAGVGPSEMSCELLRQTKPWVQFLGVLSFILSGFMMLGGVLMIILGLIGGASGGRGAMGSAISGAVLGAVYIPLALIYLYPGLKMWQFGSAIGRLMTSRSNEDMEVALGHQKSFWKYCGIFTIVSMVLYFLLIIGLFIVGIGTAARLGR